MAPLDTQSGDVISIGNGITVETVTVTPTMAEQWLEHNIDNRRHKRGSITKYAADMRAGRWKATGDGIKFGKTGRLLDGQNRLYACIEADTPFVSPVFRGLDEESQEYMDMGTSRTAADVLQMRGVTNTKQLAAVARVMISEVRGATSTKNINATTAQIIKVVERHPKLGPYTFGYGALTRGLPAIITSYLTYAGAELMGDEKNSDLFRQAMVEGIPSRQGCPVHHLRERLLRDRESKTAVKREVVSNSAKHAWNLLVDGESVKKWVFPNQNVDVQGLRPVQLVGRDILRELTRNVE